MLAAVAEHAVALSGVNEPGRGLLPFHVAIGVQAVSAVIVPAELGDEVLDLALDQPEANTAEGLAGPARAW